MKTDVILLQPFDNIDSVLDKLRQVSNAGGAARRVILIWPKRGRVIEDGIEMARLKMWLKHDDLQAALVVSNGFVRSLALEHGFPVFTNREAAETQNWLDVIPGRDGLDEYKNLQKIAALQSERERTRTKQPPRPLLYGLAFLALLSVAGMLFVLLPHAVIILPSTSAEQSLSIPFWTSDSLTAVTQNGGLPSLSERIPLELQATVPASGRFRGTGKLASGTITLLSDCEREQRIAAGTLISSESSTVLFETLQEINLAPGETLETTLIALSPGAAGNLPAGSLMMIESPFDRCVSVRQREALAGGDDGYFTAPDQADYARAADMILSQVADAVEQAVAERYGSLRMNLPGYAVVESISNEQVSPGIGFAGDQLNLRQTLQVRIRTVSAQDIGVIAKMTLDAQKADEFVPANEVITWQMETLPQTGIDDSILWTMRVRRTGFFVPDMEAIKAGLAGRPIRDAASLFQQIGLSGEAPLIRRWPRWISRFPLAPGNIRIETETY